MRKRNVKNSFCVWLAGIFFIIIIVTVFFELNPINFGEINFNNNNGNLSGEKVSTNSGKYRIDVYDDEIDFIDDNGNTIMYLFSDDRLSAVMEILVLDNKDDADVVKAFYELKIPSGEVERVVQEDTMVSVKYNIEYFEEYKNYTKDEIQSRLLEGRNFKQES